MKFSENWLRDTISFEGDTDALVHRLTMAGLEVDGVETPWEGMTNLVVAEVVSCEKHPDADRLNLTQVTDGEETYQVVCGAPNVRAGIKVVLAKVGAKLPGGFKIKKAKIRGVVSLGMICAESEIGLSDESEGIMELPADAPVGRDAIEWLGLDDTLIEVDLTPNRGDCLSLRGVARETGVMFDAPFTPAAIPEVAGSVTDTFPVSIENTEACPRYCGRVIQGVNPAADTPLWMQERLRRSGIRSISFLVDVTNYVMLELGQPMHAFDLDQLEGGIEVRAARASEKLTLLDGQIIDLREGDLVIADQKQVLALAGVMGGEASGCSDTTQTVFLESAHFAPLTMAGVARAYGLSTDSSHRFERGVDTETCKQAIERATALIVEISGGKPGPVQVIGDPEPAAAVVAHLERINSMLGMSLEASRIEGMFTSLGFVFELIESGVWSIQPPSWRFDIRIEEDIIEEVARVYGFDQLPRTLPQVGTLPAFRPEQQLPLDQVKDTIAALDYHEAITWSFTDPALQDKLSLQGRGAGWRLANPISSELAEMRTSLFPGLVQAALHNLNRQQGRVRLFETGLRFVGEGNDLEQVPTLAMISSGTVKAESWLSDTRTVDFYDVKGDVEAVFASKGQLDALSFEPLTDEAVLHPGQSAKLLLDGNPVGFMGKLHPQVQKSVGLKQPLFVVEIELDALVSSRVPSFKLVSRFPLIEKDFAVELELQHPAGAIIKEVREAGGEHLIDVRVFDEYKGEHIADGWRSLALKLVFQGQDRTLTDEEVDTAFRKVIDHITTTFNGRLRG